MFTEFRNHDYNPGGYKKRDQEEYFEAEMEDSASRAYCFIHYRGCMVERIEGRYFALGADWDTLGDAKNHIDEYLKS